MKKDIWEDDFPCKGATERQILAAEKRLGVKIPAAIKRQLKIQNGGRVVNNDWFEAVDGIMPVQEWELASESDWFHDTCLLYTSPSPRDLSTSRMPSSA